MTRDGTLSLTEALEIVKVMRDSGRHKSTIEAALSGDELDREVIAINSARNDTSYVALRRLIEKTGLRWDDAVKQATRLVGINSPISAS